MSNPPENNHADEHVQSTGRSLQDADKGREPQFVAAQMGARWISLNALTERIEAAFLEEHADNSTALREADTRSKRLQLVLATLEYVIASESIQISSSEKADLVSRVYSSIFGYGPLDTFFLDERVTTLSLEGPDSVSIRYGHGQLQTLGPIFQTAEQFHRVLRRLLMDAGAELRDDQPFVEAGLMVGDRPVCVNLTAPPVTFQITADIRLHPKTVPTMQSLVETGFLTEKAAFVLSALIRSPHGLIVVGEPESGKTTLLNVIAEMLPDPHIYMAVQRADEMRLPEEMKKQKVRWPQGEERGTTFGEAILQALQDKPAGLLLDEVRADEPETVAPLLTQPDAPRQIWSFRGAIFAKRLQSALGMLARRADSTGGERLVKAMYQRLPFVLTLNRSGERLCLWSIGEWQFKHSMDYPTYTLLMHTQEGQLTLTGEISSLPLDLPSDFWSV